MIIDVFTYTQASANGSFSIEMLIEAARSACLDGIAVTDRNSSSRAHEIMEVSKREGFPVFIGVELQTSAGRVVAYPANIDDEFVSESWRSLGEQPDVEDVLEYFHERGGIVVARDIYNRGEGLKDRVHTARDSRGHGFDALDTVSPCRRRIDNELSIEAQQVLGVPACAGSGVLDDIQNIGHCATLFAGEITDQASFVAAMRSPLHWACALRDLGEACPMGSAPQTEDDNRRGERRHFDRRDDRREGRGERHGERRFGHGRSDDRRDGEGRRGNDHRRGDGRRGDGRRGDGRRGGGDNRGRRR